MKRIYEKPEIEYIDFDIEEEILAIGGDMGTSDMPEDWE